MNIFNFVDQFSLAERLSWAIIHSLWIGIILGVVVGFTCHLFRNSMGLKGKYYLVLGYQFFLLVLFFGLLLVPNEKKVIVWQTEKSQDSINRNESGFNLAKDQLETFSQDSLKTNISVQKPFNNVEIDVLEGVDFRSFTGFSHALLILYFIGLAYFTLKGFYGYHFLNKKVFQRSVKASNELETIFHNLKARFRIRKDIQLLLCDSIASPIVYGFLKPIIIFPSSCILKLNPIQTEAILLHELDHILNNDHLFNHAQIVIETILFFHPAVKWAGKVTRSLREFRCDQYVTKSLNDVELEYAKALSNLANSQVMQCAPAATDGPLLSRIKSILGLRKENAVSQAKLPTKNVLAICSLIGLLIFTFYQYSQGHKSSLYSSGKLVKDVNLQGWFGWKNLPFQITSEEENLIRKCNSLASKYRSTVNGERLFAKEEVLNELTTLLQQNPDHFYIQQLLSSWYTLNHQYESAAELRRLALNNAPRVFIQRFLDEEKKPIPGLVIQNFELECNRVKNRYLDPSLKLLFVNSVTDEEGCIYLPSFNTVIRATTMSHPQGWDARFPRLGWFKGKTKYSLLPDANCVRMNPDQSESLRQSGISLSSGTKLRIAGIQFGFEPKTWRDIYGKEISVPVTWQNHARGKALTLVMDMWDQTGLTDFELAKMDSSGAKDVRLPKELSAGGLSGFSSGNRNLTVKWYGKGSTENLDKEQLLDIYRNLEFIVRTGAGSFELVSEIQPNIPLTKDEFSFDLQKAKSQRKEKILNIGPFGLGGRRLQEGLTLVDLRYVFDPMFEIVLRAQHESGSYVYSAPSIGAGNYSNSKRRIYSHLKIDANKVSKFEVVKRPIEKMPLIDIGNLAKVILLNNN